MNRIKVLLVEDNEDTSEIIEYFLNSLPDFQIIGKCCNGEELVEEVMRKKPDLVLTDINMPKKNGIEAMKECLSFFPNLKFIFLTGYSEYAIEAFRLSAVDYIVKPIEKNRLFIALEKAKNLLDFEKGELVASKSVERIRNLSLRDQNSTRYIPLTDIYFIEKIGKKCLVYTKEAVHETNETIGKILDRLDHFFYQAHRAFIINLQKVSYIKQQNETFIACFQDYDKQASISKLKINEVKEKISTLQR